MGGDNDDLSRLMRDAARLRGDDADADRAKMARDLATPLRQQKPRRMTRSTPRLLAAKIEPEDAT